VLRVAAATRCTGCPGLRPLDVLLAEDGEVNQEVAVGLLEMQGHRVEVANNGKEAIAALRRRRFDVVLIDLEMPEMDGLDATRIIRTEETATGAHIPIIATTAHALPQLREYCLKAGMDGYITKPITPKELYRALESVAGARG
jgi:CheY-like chemotaxis protein